MNSITIEKIKRKIWGKIVAISNHTSFYCWLYKSYWHFKFNKNDYHDSIGLNVNYYSAVPNQGAGIGHQMANWIAGYWFAKQFKLKFAHIPFSNSNWEYFLGFGADEVSAQMLVTNQKYRKILLPLFDENNIQQVALINDIIRSYRNQKVVFVAEQDQFYRDQYGVIEDLKRKFYSAKARIDDHIIYNPACYNIAIHVRRGDITVGQKNQNPNLLLRWQDNDYFVHVLQNVITNAKTDKPLRIYLFSQGKIEDFTDFNKFENLTYCLDMGAKESFLHMVYADILITSKSSFSYKPALISNGIKVVPNNFWHGYPSDFILQTME